MRLRLAPSSTFQLRNPHSRTRQHCPCRSDTCPPCSPGTFRQSMLPLPSSTCRTRNPHTPMPMKRRCSPEIYQPGMQPCRWSFQGSNSLQGRGSLWLQTMQVDNSSPAAHHCTFACRRRSRCTKTPLDRWFRLLIACPQYSSSLVERHCRTAACRQILQGSRTPPGTGLLMLRPSLHRSSTQRQRHTRDLYARHLCSRSQLDILLLRPWRNSPDSRSRLLPCTAAYHWRSQCRSTQASRLLRLTPPIQQGNSARRLCRRPRRCQVKRPQQPSKTFQLRIVNRTPWRVSCMSQPHTVCTLTCWSTFRCRTLCSRPPRRSPPRERVCLRGMASTRLIPQKRHTCPRRTECMSTRAGHPLPSCIFPLCTESIVVAEPQVNMFPPGTVNSCRIQQMRHIFLLRMGCSGKMPKESTSRSGMPGMILLSLPPGSSSMCLPCNENKPTPMLYSCTCRFRTLSNPIWTLLQVAPKTCPVRS